MNISQVQKKSKLLRINRFLALNLNISRRDSDTLVEKKNVKINGKIAQHGDSVDEDDIVMFKNEVVQPTSEHEYYLFYKPYGYVSSHKRQGDSKIIYDLINNKSLKFGGREPGQEASVAEDLFAVLETTRIVGLLLAPLLPDLSERILAQLGQSLDQNNWSNQLNWGRLSGGSALPKPTPVMQRLELDDPL